MRWDVETRDSSVPHERLMFQSRPTLHWVRDPSEQPTIPQVSAEIRRSNLKPALLTSSNVSSSVPPLVEKYLISGWLIVVVIAATQVLLHHQFTTVMLVVNTISLSTFRSSNSRLFAPADSIWHYVTTMHMGSLLLRLHYGYYERMYVST